MTVMWNPVGYLPGLQVVPGIHTSLLLTGGCTLTLKTFLLYWMEISESGSQLSRPILSLQVLNVKMGLRILSYSMVGGPFNLSLEVWCSGLGLLSPASISGHCPSMRMRVTPPAQFSKADNRGSPTAVLGVPSDIMAQGTGP